MGGKKWNLVILVNILDEDVWNYFFANAVVLLRFKLYVRLGPLTLVEQLIYEEKRFWIQNI